MRIRFEHWRGGGSVGGVEPLLKERARIGVLVLEQLRGQPELGGVEGPERIRFGIPTGGSSGMRGPDGAGERGEVDPR